MMMLQEAGLGVAFEGKPALRAAIDTQINYSDLTALLYLQAMRQGFHRIKKQPARKSQLFI